MGTETKSRHAPALPSIHQSVGGRIGRGVRRTKGTCFRKDTQALLSPLLTTRQAEIIDGKTDLKQGLGTMKAYRIVPLLVLCCVPFGTSTAQTGIPSDSVDLLAKLKEFRSQRETELKASIDASRAAAKTVLEQELQQETRMGNLDAAIKLRAALEELAAESSPTNNSAKISGLPTNSANALTKFGESSRKLQAAIASEILKKSAAVADILDAHVRRETTKGNLDAAVELRKVIDELRAGSIAASAGIAANTPILVNENFDHPSADRWATTPAIQFAADEVRANANTQKLTFLQPVKGNFRVAMKVRIEGDYRYSGWDFSIQLTKPNVQGVVRFDHQKNDFITFATDDPMRRYRGHKGQERRTAGTSGTLILERRGTGLTFTFVNRRGQQTSIDTTIDDFEETQLVFWIAGRAESPRFVEEIVITGL